MKTIVTGQYRSDAKRHWNVLVDDADYELLKQFNWCVDKQGSVSGLVSKTPRKRMLLHRYILQAPEHLEVDHIDGDRLNNQRSNLRLATSSQNKANRGPRKDCKSGYKGVSLHKKLRKWTARVKTPATYKHIGVFNTKEDAARAYNKAAIEVFGPFAWLNPV